MKNKENDNLTQLVECVTRDVLARLMVTNDAAQHEPGTGRETIRLPGCVISLVDLAQVPSNAREVHVSSTAVVTPAARDELRERGVQVVRGQQQRTEALTARSATPLVVGLAETTVVIDHALAGLRRQGIRIEQLPRLPLVEQIEAMVEQVVRGGRRGVLVTGEAAAALCLTNRHGGVRAVVGINKQSVRRDVERLAANLLVVDPVARSTFEVVQLLGEFAVATAGVIPNSLRSRLK
jgi:hypothetical protein